MDIEPKRRPCRGVILPRVAVAVCYVDGALLAEAFIVIKAAAAKAASSRHSPTAEVAWCSSSTA